MQFSPPLRGNWDLRMRLRRSRLQDSVSNRVFMLQEPRDSFVTGLQHEGAANVDVRVHRLSLDL